MNNVKNYIVKITLLNLVLLSGCGSAVELECAAGSHIDASTGEESCLPEFYATIDQLPGDCNRDGQVTATDAQCIAHCIEGSAPESADCELRSDCNCDGEVTASDAQCAAYRALNLPVVDQCDIEPEAFEVVFELEATPETIGRFSFDIDYSAAEGIDDTSANCFLVIGGGVGSAIVEASADMVAVGISSDSGINAPVDLVRCTGLSARKVPEASDFAINITSAKTVDRSRDLAFDQIEITPRIERQLKPFDVVFELKAAPELLGRLFFDVDYSGADPVNDDNAACHNLTHIGSITHERVSNTINVLLAGDEGGMPAPPSDLVRCTGFVTRSLPDPNDFAIHITDVRNIDLIAIPIDQIIFTPRIERD